jgi:hypothetical protein
MSHPHEEIMRNRALETDKKDLVEFLKTRFGVVPESVQKRIEGIDDLNFTDKLFLAAATAADWEIFLNQLYADKDAFQITGEEFNPLAKTQKK